MNWSRFYFLNRVLGLLASSLQGKMSLREEGKNDSKKGRRVLTALGDLKIEADTVASLSEEEEDSEVTTACRRVMTRLFWTGCFLRVDGPGLLFWPTVVSLGGGGLWPIT